MEKLQLSPEQRKERRERLKVTLIREDGRLERHCEHGVGHTVGHINHRYSLKGESWFWVHGCCG